MYTIWREEGLQVPRKQPKRARLWLADGSCIRRRAEYPNHVWSYDFVAERTHDGRPLRILNILDEYTRECLASVVARRIRSQDVLVILADSRQHGLTTPQPWGAATYPRSHPACQLRANMVGGTNTPGWSTPDLRTGAAAG